jgi:hypothetical protein
MPERAYSMPWSSVRSEMLTQQSNILNAFKNSIKLWEGMNEAPETNALNVARTDMNDLLVTAAANVKAVTATAALVNAPHEINFGAKYLYYNLKNEPADVFPATYFTLLNQLKAANGLSNVGTVGLQFYPGYKLNAGFGGLEGPAMTPSWLVDTVARYSSLGLPIHISEFSVPSSNTAAWKNGYWREPWTETAPTGSSTLSTRSTKTMPPTTRTPPIIPMMAAPIGVTNAQGAVMATSPASVPLAVMDGSGLPHSFQTRNMAAMQPVEAEMNVLTMTIGKRRSVAARVDAPLKPIQPNTRTMHPRTASGRLWPRIARGLPSLPNLPSRSTAPLTVSG